MSVTLTQRRRDILYSVDIVKSTCFPGVRGLLRVPFLVYYGLLSHGWSAVFRGVKGAAEWVMWRKTTTTIA